MAMQLPGEDDAPREAHDINVTPFIDVILVLLIIFMVAAPLATVDIPVDLPGITAPPQPRPTQPVFLTVQADLTLRLGENEVPPDGLAAALDAATGADPQPRPTQPVFLTVQADLTLRLGENEVPPDGLAAALDAATGADHEQRIFLRADKVVPYGDLMEAMNRLRAIGYLKVALVGLERSESK
jgi:biopolymer transport protein ExbD